MTIIKRMLSLTGVIILAFLLTACADDGTVNTAMDDNQADGEDMAELDDNQAESNGIILTVVSPSVTEAQDGAASGTLNVTIIMENTTEETVSLDFVAADYVLAGSDGLNSVPTTIDDVLIEPEIEAGATVTGEISYAVTDAASTQLFTVGDFEEIEIDVEAEPDSD